MSDREEALAPSRVVAVTTEIVAAAELDAAMEIDAAGGRPTTAPLLLAVTVLPRRWRGRR